MTPNDPNSPQPLPLNVHALFLLLFLVFALYLAYSMLSPFLHTLILSTVMAVIFQPVQARLLTLCKGRRTLAAALTTLVIVVALVIPLTFFFLGLANQGVQAVTAVNTWVRGTDFNELLNNSQVAEYTAWFKERIPFVDLDKLDIQSRAIEYSKTIGQEILRTGTQLVTNVAGLGFHFLLMGFMVFYFLRDGESLAQRLKTLLPLRASQTDSIFDSLRRVSRSVLVGSLLVAVLQGLAGGVGLALIGFPALFWGTMMAFTSLIPVIGTGVVWIPSVLYLLIVGKTQAAVFFLLWCVVLVSSIDTFLRPYFLRGTAKVPTFYIFLSILGGLNAFGPLGILYGPLVLSFAMVMLQIYGDEYCDPKTSPRGCQG